MRAWQLMIALSCVASAGLGAEPLTVRSPDGKLELAFTGAAEGRLAYSLRADGRSLINASPLGSGVGSAAAFAGTATNEDSPCSAHSHHHQSICRDRRGSGRRAAGEHHL